MADYLSKREQQLEMESYVEKRIDELRIYIDEQTKEMHAHVEKRYAIRLVQTIVFGAIGIIAAAVMSALVYSVVKKY